MTSLACCTVMYCAMLLEYNLISCDSANAQTLSEGHLKEFCKRLSVSACYGTHQTLFKSHDLAGGPFVVPSLALSTS